MLNKVTIRRLLNSLIHRRQKLHDMNLRRFTLPEATAVSKLKRELEYRTLKNDESHVSMVRTCADHILVLLPGRGTRFYKFREQLKDMIRICQHEGLQDLYR